MHVTVLLVLLLCCCNQKLQVDMINMCCIMSLQRESS